MPIFAFMMFFLVDMGYLVFISGILHDAAYVSARASAQSGGAYTPDPSASNAPIYQSSFVNALSGVPGISATTAASMVSVSTGGTCATSGPNSYVTIQVNYNNVPLAFPGLISFLHITGAINLSAVGVARCEVVAGS
jgi:hypothetical protein